MRHLAKSWLRSTPCKRLMWSSLVNNTGVSFNKPTQKWYSLLTINGRNRFGGSFFTEKDAARRTDR